MVEVVTKKNGRKRSNPIKRGFILFVMLLASVVMGYTIINELMETYHLNTELKETKLSKAELEEKKEELILQKKNLNDTEYLIRYARAKYLATKDDGEQVFKLPEEESKENE